MADGNQADNIGQMSSLLSCGLGKPGQALAPCAHGPVNAIQATPDLEVFARREFHSRSDGSMVIKVDDFNY